MHSRAHADLDVGLWHSLGQIVSSSPAGAVPWHEDVRRDCLNLIQRARNDRVEEAASKVHATDESVNVLDASKPLRIANDVDGAGVAAAG